MRITQPPFTFLINSAIDYRRFDVMASHVITPSDPNFLTSVITDFFFTFNQVINEGRYNLLYQHPEVKELVTTYVISDMEGMGPIPMEFAEKEVELIEGVVEWLLHVLLSIVDAECFCPGMELTLVRCLRNDMVLRYDHPHCLFKVASNEQRRQLQYQFFWHELLANHRARTAKEHSQPR